MRVILIEDEQAIAKSLIKALSKKGFAVDWESEGEKGYEEIKCNEYDCILLDLNLPDTDGIDIAKKLRESGNNTPILMLTARTTQDDILDGFESGTDDYLPKPFDFRELVFRINSLIKRNSKVKNTYLQVDGIKLDTNSKKVYVNDKYIELNNKEIGILEYLMRNQGKHVSQEELLEHVWDREIDIFTETVRTNVKTLRKKVDPKKKVIKTVRGRGYIVD